MRPGVPEWIECRFAGEQVIRRVELVFNSDLNSRRGRSGLYPELARQYELRALTADGEYTVATVTDNTQRFRTHVFDPVPALGLRLLIYATWGHTHAEVFDMRVYASTAGAALR